MASSEYKFAHPNPFGKPYNKLHPPSNFDWNKSMFPPIPTPPRATHAKATPLPPPPPPPPQPNRFTATSNRFAALYPSADHLPISDESDYDADDADDDAPDPELLAEFDELIHYNDAIQAFASKQFAAHPDPCFKHPLQYALHLMNLGLATLSSPPSEPIANLHVRGVQVTPEPAPHTPPPRHAERGVQTTPTPAPSFSPPPPVWKPRPASPVPRPAKTPTSRSTSPSTRATFDKVLTQLSALRSEVSPPPSPPLTPRSASPAPQAEDHIITIAVPLSRSTGPTTRGVSRSPLRHRSPPFCAGGHLAAVLWLCSVRPLPPHESGHQGPPRDASVSS